MCGIIGYNGSEKTIPVLIDGLKKLEYRGYDSSGIAFVKENNVNVVKSIGKIVNLEKKINYDENSSIGIGHTRWATHGAASERNSHPHQVGDITIVHNGIIENYIELKAQLIKEGYAFKSDTDTEVACALIDYFYKKTNDIKKALIMFKENVQGAYALGIIVKNNENIYATRKNCPLILGTGKSGNLIASDTLALKNYADRIIYLDEDSIAELSKTDIKIYNKELKKIKLNFENIPVSDIETDKNGYDHYMLKEICEQPSVFKKTAIEYTTDGIDSLLDKMPDLTKYNKIDIVACGSAYHAGLVGKNFIEEYANIPVNVEIASEYRYKKIFYDKNSLVILVSQSGETADTLACLRKAKEDNIDTLAIVNVLNSSMSRETKICINTKAGREIAVATTKAYSAQVAVLSLIAFSLAIKKGNINRKEIKEILKEINKLPFLIENTINNFDYEQLATKLYNKDDIFFIGRGIDYALAMEGSLKLKEISYIPSQAYAAGELKHGTISLIDNGTPVIGIVTDERLKDKMISNIEEVKSRGAEVILVTNDSEVKNYDHMIYIPKTHKILQPLLTILPLQLLSYEIAKLRNCDIDKPKNLAKSVTVE